MSEWREVTLGDVVELKRGYDLPAAQRRPGPVPIVSSSGRSGFHDEAKVSGPGVVTGRYGTLGEVFFIEEDFWPLNTALYVRDFKGNDPRFVAALLASLDLGRSDGASAVPGVNRNHLHVLPVSVPDRTTQAGIAGILTAVDDLIENSRRRIALLERMAQAIYREWFVHFRYPGHEDDQPVDSLLGPIPSGWEVAEIGTVVETIGGGTPSRQEPRYWENGTITWFTPSDLTKARAMFVSSTASTITSEGLARSSARMFPRRSVLMTSRATIGVVSISSVEASTNQGFIICVPNDRLSEYHLYYWLVENVPEFLALASGATFKELTRGTFRKLLIAVPPEAVERRFFDLVQPLGGTIERLLSVKAVAESVHHALLPRLVTGAIDVSRIDLDARLDEPSA